MIKRVNSTGRRRITRDHVEVEVFDDDPRTFNASIDLSDFDAPSDAHVVIEAKCAGSNTIPRFPWGTIGYLTPPASRELRDLKGKHVFFTLKVIDRTERFGRILGMAENIRPIRGGEKTATGREGILPIEPSDQLGEELWRLDFDGPAVSLLVNDQLPGGVDRFRYDPLVYTLIFPSIIRDVLRGALNEFGDLEEDEDHWSTLWLRFGKNLCPEREVPQTNRSDDEEREEWIKEVVAAFCHEHALKQKFRQASSSPTAWEDEA